MIQQDSWVAEEGSHCVFICRCACLLRALHESSLLLPNYKKPCIFHYRLPGKSAHHGAKCDFEDIVHWCVARLKNGWWVAVNSITEVSISFFCMVWRWPSGKTAPALYATLKCVSAHLCYYKYISSHLYSRTDSTICFSSPFLSSFGWGNEHWYWLQFPAMLHSTPWLYQESNSYQPRCRLTNSPGCCPGQQLMNTRGMNDAQRYFSSKEQVATVMIMMRLRLLVCRNVFLSVPVYSMLPRRKACNHACVSLACMHACTALCVVYFRRVHIWM